MGAFPLTSICFFLLGLNQSSAAPLVTMNLGSPSLKGSGVSLKGAALGSIDKNCPPGPKPLTMSLMDGWKEASQIQTEVLKKIKGAGDVSCCLPSNSTLSTMGGYGKRLGVLVTRLHCLLMMQRSAGCPRSDLFMRASSFNPLYIAVDEIMKKPEVCQAHSMASVKDCPNVMGDILKDSTTIKNKERVYQLGYQIVTELQSYVEKMYLTKSSDLNPRINSAAVVHPQFHRSPTVTTMTAIAV